LSSHSPLLKNNLPGGRGRGNTQEVAGRTPRPYFQPTMFSKLTNPEIKRSTASAISGPSNFSSSHGNLIASSSLSSSPYLCRNAPTPP